MEQGASWATFILDLLLTSLGAREQLVDNTNLIPVRSGTQLFKQSKHNILFEPHFIEKPVQNMLIIKIVRV